MLYVGKKTSNNNNKKNKQNQTKQNHKTLLFHTGINYLQSVILLVL